MGSHRHAHLYIRDDRHRDPLNSRLPFRVRHQSLRNIYLTFYQNSSDLFNLNVSVVMIGAECYLALDALSKTLDLFEFWELTQS